MTQNSFICCVLNKVFRIYAKYMCIVSYRVQLAGVCVVSPANQNMAALLGECDDHYPTNVYAQGLICLLQ